MIFYSHVTNGMIRRLKFIRERNFVKIFSTILYIFAALLSKKTKYAHVFIFK